MKNKNILYLITILITLFSFNLNVNAAQELTCVYEKPGNWDIDSVAKMLLIQYESGEKVVYHNYSDVDIKSYGWQKLPNLTIYIDDVPEDQKDYEGNLTTCPTYGNLNSYGIEDEDGYAIFRDTPRSGIMWAYEKITPNGSQKVVNEPTYVEVKQADTTAGDWLSTIDGEKHTGSCKYKKTLEDGQIHYIIMNFGKEHISFTEYDPEKGEYSGVGITQFEVQKPYNVGTIIHTYGFGVDEKFNAKYLLEQYDGDCPAFIKVTRTTDINEPAGKSMVDTYIHASNKAGESTYYIDEEDPVRGKNPLTNQPLTWAGKYNPTFATTTITSCEDLFGEKIAGQLNIIWKIIKIGVPILLIGLGTIDFAQAVFSGKEDDMKKVQGKFIKRIIIAVVIFLVPTLLSLILNIADSIWGNIGSDLCGIIF